MTDNRTTELLPCPFCGGEAELYSTVPTHDGFWSCICRDCGASTSFGSEAEAITAWNTRAEDAASTEMAQRIQSLELECAKLQDELRKAGNRGGLTAEQVQTAIFNGSSYASYDGAMYYANGISMQAIADELNEELRKAGNRGECEKLPQLSDTVCVVEKNGFEMRFGYWRCSECGCENFEGAKHCMNCGRKAVKR